MADSAREAGPNDESTPEVVVLVPAAGQGTRLGGERKQFRRLGSRPLLVQTLLVFERHPNVHHLVVIAPEEAVRQLRDTLAQAGLTKVVAVVAGGATRQASVATGLRAVPERAKAVLVHDAVRPFVRSEQVRSVIKATREGGAAALAVPVTDTLRCGTDGQFAETVSRDQLFRVQTPQGFRRRWLEDAHADATQGSTAATDDAELVQRQGHPVRIVPGGRHNIKITTADDWELAQALWPRWVDDVSDAQL